MKIYTKTGDGGETGLFGGGRVSKADARVEAYGSVDELNAVIGSAIAQLPDEPTREQLALVQSDLFSIGAHLATPAETRGKRPQLPPLPVDRVSALEAAMDRMEQSLPELRTFILPGGTSAGAALHQARTVARRAERRVIALATGAAVDPAIVVYLNRLSDYLFVLARFTNYTAGVAERPWAP
jgi:cob(I)alamin adenosyltransferase